MIEVMKMTNKELEKLGDIKINLVDELHKDTIGCFFSQNHPFNHKNLQRRR